jgi:flagellar biosynthetic protein FliR
VQPLFDQILTHGLPIALRVGAVMTFAPFFGSSAVAVRVKAIFTLILTALLYPVCSIPKFSLAPSVWIRIVVSEIVLGLAIGLCLQFVLEGAQLAGQIVGFQFAFSLVNVIDPQTNVDTPVLSTFHQLGAVLLFLQMDVHHWILRGLVKSFEYVPVGSVTISAAAARDLFRDVRGVWLSGLQMALPILLATMFLDVVIGFLSKASPQMPALFLSVPLKSLVGYAVLAMTIVMWPGFFEKQFTLALGWAEHFMLLAH